MRLTTRGWWLLMVSVGLLTAGLVGPLVLHALYVLLSDRNRHDWQLYTSIPALVLLGVTLCGWYFWSWLWFAWSSRLALRRLSAERSVLDEHGPVRHLFVGRSFLVRLRVKLESPVGLEHVVVDDRLPAPVRHLSGQNWQQGPLREGQPLTFEYRVRCTGMGVVRFDGVRMRISDLCGLFYRSIFVPAPCEIRVLPVLSDDIGQPAMRKRINLLPPPGAHRLLRPGSGSELLDLREYLPGDPPKTIAWKVSAKRDRLITKEYISEVPVRCTLFVDTSNSVRLGLPGRNALSRLVEIAAAVAQANTSMRDLTGLCLFDETGTRMIRPARTARHLADMTNMLADAAGMPPTTGDADLNKLLRLAYAFADETYPELMDNTINRVPATLARDWPLWRHQRSRRTPLGQVGRAVAWTVVTTVYVSIALGEWSFVVWFLDQIKNQVRPPSEESLGTVFVLLAAMFYLPFTQFVLDSLSSALSPRRRQLARWRKKLAALLALRYRLGAGGLGVLLEDNHQLTLCLQRFLGEHQIPYALPPYDAGGRYRFASTEKLEMLERALLYAVGRGHDNELFVLLVDLLDLSDRMEPVLAAVRVALARHHQVAVILAWPPGEPAPTSRSESPAAQFDRMLVDSLKRTKERLGWTREWLQVLVRQHLHREYHAARKAFLRLGVPVVCADSGEPVHLILERLEKLRGIRSRR